MSPDQLLEAFPLLFLLLAGLVGLIVGSFLNVVILRLPVMMERQWHRDCAALLARGDVNSDVDSDSENSAAQGETTTHDDAFSLAFPASHCPQCHAPVRAWQNIPVLSYLLLRGRCASCRSPIGPRYPFVELLTGLATLVVVLHAHSWPELTALLMLTWSLIALAGIDIDTQLLPDDITLPLLWAGLLYNLFFGPVALADAVTGAAAGYLLLWSIYWAFKLITGKEGMGYGDFKLLAALGAWLGWQSLPVIILLSSLVGAVIGLSLILFQGRDRAQPMPFGPYLAVAGWIALYWGNDVLRLLSLTP